MAALFLHDSAARTKRRFEPLDPQHVKLYVCGPTVYDLAHLGNARPVVVFDVLARLLRRLYPRVTYARNIKDVDDKINSRARDSGVDSIADECVELSDIEPADQVQAAWRRTQIDTRLKLLAKWSPKKYGDRTAVEHQGGISLTVVTGVPQPDAITGRKPDAKQIT